MQSLIAASRFSIKRDLLAYGEEELASRVDHASDADLNAIGQLAMKHIGERGYVARHIVLGAIEFYEGVTREPRRKRRDMSVYQQMEPEPKENVWLRIAQADQTSRKGWWSKLLRRMKP